MNKFKIKYYVVTVPTATNLEHLHNAIKTKNLYTVSAYEFACLEYNRRVKTINEGQAVYLIADFGTTKEGFFKASTINADEKYFPFLVVKTTDNIYSCHNILEDKDTKIILDTSGIEQTFFDPDNAFKKFQKYINGRVSCEMYLKYRDPKTSINERVKLTSIVDLLLGEVKYMKKFKLVS